MENKVFFVKEMSHGTLMFPPGGKRKYNRRPGDNLRTWQVKTRVMKIYMTVESCQSGRKDMFNALAQAISGYAFQLAIPKWMIEIAAEQDRKSAMERILNEEIRPEIMADLERDISKHVELWKGLAKR